MPEEDHAIEGPPADKVANVVQVSGSWSCNCYTLKFFAYVRNNPLS
jgi:hypothetical protein